MKTLKKESLKGMLLAILLFLGIGIILACAALPSMINLFKGPVSFDEVNFDEDIEGLYVAGTVYGIYDWYCEQTEDGKTISREYLIDADGYYYMGFRAEKDDISKANALMDASILYLDGEDDGTLLEQKQYYFEGVIKAMPTTSLNFYHEALHYSDMDTATQDMFLPYYVDVNHIGNYNTTEAIMMTLGALLFIILGIIFTILPLAGVFLGSVKKYISASSNPDMARERVNYFIDNTPKVKGLRYNRDFICGQAGATTTFGETSKLVWVYLHSTKHSYNFIPTGTTYELILAFTDGRRRSVKMKNEKISHEHMKNLSELCPQAIFGYSDELDKLFRKDLTGFLNLRYNKTQAADIISGNYENMTN